jgi:O-antigen/teichoic acid export membrane protein
VARIIFFLATPIAQVLMPLVKTDQPARQNRQLFLKSLLLTVLVCGVVLLACALMPEFIIRTLMGVEYITYASLLPPLTLAIFIISIVNLIFMYFLALRRKMIMVVGIIGLVVCVGLMLAWHDNLHAIVQSMLLGSIFTLVATGIYVLVNLKRGVRNAEQNDLDRHSNL